MCHGTGHTYYGTGYTGYSIGYTRCTHVLRRITLLDAGATVLDSRATVLDTTGPATFHIHEQQCLIQLPRTTRKHAVAAIGSHCQTVLND